MTLSLNPRNSAHRETTNLLAHHDEYDKPQLGATLRLGVEQVHLTGDEAIRLGLFLAGGHAALEERAHDANAIVAVDEPIIDSIL